jgi:hypothetical protein
MPSTVTGSADQQGFEDALAAETDAIFQCISGGGTSELGKVMTVRVVSMPGKPSQTTLLATDLPPAAKSCMEQVVTGAKWPTAGDGTSEVTLRLVLITRVWVDDPKGACPPR